MGAPVAALTECDPLVTVFDAWVADAARTQMRPVRPERTSAASRVATRYAFELRA